MKHAKKLAASAAAAVMLISQGSMIPMNASAAADEFHDDWLHVNENAEIVDMNGNPVWLTGVNWFGYNVGSQVFDGVWSANMHHCLELIADHGFNLLRVPMSTEIILQWKNGGKDPMVKVNTYENPELTLEGEEGGTIMYSFDIWNLAVKWCRELGIKIMMDIHSASTNAAGHNYALWYDPSFSDADWIEALSWFADYYKDDDTLIAIDLKNEPHGKRDDGTFAKWDGSSDDNNWRYAAERGAAACLAKNPNLLIMVEGIEVYPKFEEGEDWNSNSVDYTRYPWSPYHGAWWGANFRGAKDYPVNLGEYQSQLVYSPHDYGPMVWKQDWFHLEGEAPNFTSYEFTTESLLDEYWRDTWAFLVEDKISPLLMGEWGGWTDDEHDPSGANRHWMKLLRDYMIEKRIHHTFWCFNENSSDTGGLMYDNFQKWDDVKYEFVKPALWQDENGTFISLDHTIPIGKNGQSLTEYYSTHNGILAPPAGSGITTTGTTTNTTSGTTTASETTATTAVSTSEVSVTSQSSDTTASSSASAAKVKLGDANCDGKITVSDAVLLSRVNAEDNSVTISDQGLVNGDVDGAAGISVGDVTLVLKYLAGLAKESDFIAQ
ncbi:MAG: cellulase family glycosylhydrolase [Oscillospiraceae bacterium]|nr:cellulase family glycosylhydrolase [Oscillospiraceae bacterium]